MSTIMVISQIILCILSVVVVIAVLMQKPAEGTTGAAFGQGGAHAKAMKSRSVESKLNTITKYGAIVLLCLSLILVIIQRFVA